jgi:hypothetical protein
VRLFLSGENAANCVGAWITYGVRKIKSSSRELLATLRLKTFPRNGMSPRMGIFCSEEDLSRCIRPPMTTVCPLGVMATVLAETVSMTGALTPGRWEPSGSGQWMSPAARRSSRPCRRW